MTHKLSASLALAATLFCGHVLAQNVEIKDAWARATVQSQ
jgi:copper(I)-binding protein